MPINSGDLGWSTNPYHSSVRVSQIMQIALTGRLLKPIPRFRLKKINNMKKERLDETHLPTKRIGSQTSPWFSRSDVDRWWPSDTEGTSCKGACTPFCVDAAIPVQGYFYGD